MNHSYERRIIVTGGAGFIGSNFLNIAVPRYPQYLFVNVDSLTSVADLKNIQVGAASNYLFEQVDIRNKEALQKLFIEHAPTHIIHLAAESHVDASIQNPTLFLETNILGTAHLLALAHEHAVVRFHHVSTDEVYGALTPTEPAFTELSLVKPNNPYSASKAGADHLVQAYHTTFGLNTVITRCSNNYGPRQDLTKFIPRAITTLLKGEPIPVYGKGENIRDWIHVTDHAEAIDTVFHTGKSGEIYNIGTDNEWRNIDIARTLLELLGKTEEQITFVADRPGHDLRYAIDSSKVQKLGWSPKIPFAEGLKKTVAWYTERA